MSGRAMRRTDRRLPERAALEVLDRADYGFLATAGPGGEPYVVAVNHVLVGRTIYFHSARAGHKVDFLTANPRTCFSAVVDAQVEPVRQTTYYRSAVAFCRARLLWAGEEKSRALRALLDRFAPGQADCGGHELVLVALDIETISGKGNLPA